MVKAAFLEKPQAYKYIYILNQGPSYLKVGGQKKTERQIDNFPNLRTKLQSCNMA